MKEKNNERSLPYDLSAEAALLSAMMVDPITVTKSISEVKEEFFYKKQHRVIFEAVKQLFQEQVEIDIITLISKLESMGTIEKAGGEPYVLEIADIVVSGSNFPYHLKIVTDKYMLRELIVNANNIVEKCYEGEMSSEVLLDYAEQTMYRLSESTERKGFQRADQYTTKVLKSIEDISTSKNHVHGIGSGLRDIDSKIGGFRPGQLIILAARPSVGKSALAINIATHVALEDKAVAIFTMEMSAEEVLVRMLSATSGVPMDALTKGMGMSNDKYKKLLDWASVLDTKNIYIDDSGTNTPLDIRAKTRRLKAEIKNLDLVIIDYLQLMSVSKKVDNRQQEISEISRNLKILAKELEVPVIALSQLNRSAESRDDKMPRLHDLRESGAIEQDADIVMFIFKEALKDKEQIPGNVVCINIAKNRQGEIGILKLIFKATTTSFNNYEYSGQQAEA